MNLNSASWRPVIVLAIVAAVLLLGAFSATPARADLPTDGRINIMPWVNSWGAVAVYCVDQNGGHGSYHLGGIRVTSSTGQLLLTATEAQILKAGVPLQGDVIIMSTPLYTLFRQSDGYFRLESAPDKEGKTFLGRWHDCFPVAPASGGSAPSATCVEYVDNTADFCHAVCNPGGSALCKADSVLEPFFGILGDFCQEVCWPYMPQQ